MLNVSQGRICHSEIEAVDPTFYLTQSQYTDTTPTSPSADPLTPGAWQGSHWSVRERSLRLKPESNPVSSERPGKGENKSSNKDGGRRRGGGGGGGWGGCCCLLVA